MSCVAFADDISSKFIYIHVDNVAAQSALINAGSVNHSSRSLVYLFLDFEQRLKFVPWISRVASASNIADGPSRSSMDEVESLGAECFHLSKRSLQIYNSRNSSRSWNPFDSQVLMMGWFLLTDQMFYLREQFIFSRDVIFNSTRWFLFHVPSTHWNFIFSFHGNCQFEAIRFNKCRMYPSWLKRKRGAADAIRHISIAFI